MKSLFRPFMIVAVAASLFAVSSCTKTCDDGFEKDADDKCIASNLKFVGLYNVSETANVAGTDYNFTFASNITVSSAGADKISISNFANSNQVITATVSANSITITDAPVSISGTSYTANGTGTLSSGDISLNYTVKRADGTTLSSNQDSYDRQ
jgi:hypothetical protein